jgi:hypothetical protein
MGITDHGGAATMHATTYHCIKKYLITIDKNGGGKKIRKFKSQDCGSSYVPWLRLTEWRPERTGERMVVSGCVFNEGSIILVGGCREGDPICVFNCVSNDGDGRGSGGH